MLNMAAFKKNKVEPTRYHLYYKKKDTVAVSAKEWNIKSKLAESSRYELCNEERCLLCWSFHLAKSPNIQKGELLVFTHEGNIDDIIVVEEEFDPYDEEIHDMEDLIKLGYARPIQYLELWSD